MDAINFIIENWATILGGLTALVTAASAITALTPTPTDDAVVAKIYKFIEIIALNIGKAKDK